MTQDELYDILKIALRASSPYNLQPWRFKSEQNTLLIYIQLKGEGFKNFKDLPFYCLGPLLENLVEGAKYYQFKAEYQLLTHTDPLQPICQVTFTKDESLVRSDITPIINRFTNRKSYRKIPIAAHVLMELKNIYEGPTQRIQNITGNTMFIESSGQLEGLRIKNFKLFQELVNSLRFSVQDSIKSKDGLCLKTMDLHANTILYLNLARIPFFAPILSLNPIAYFLASYYHKLLLQNTGLLIIFVEKDLRPKNIVDDWMKIQKICNYLYSIGLQSQIVASSLDILKIPNEFYSKSEQKILQKYYTQIAQAVGEEPSNLLTILRIGYAKEVPIRSLRHDPQDLFLPEK